MRLWGQTFRSGQRTKEFLVELNITKRIELRVNENMFISALSELSRCMDLERPVIMQKHLEDLYKFGRSVFLPSDFVEEVDFDRFVVELIADA